jgi:hypothetical protein
MHCLYAWPPLLFSLGAEYQNAFVTKWSPQPRDLRNIIENAFVQQNFSESLLIIMRRSRIIASPLRLNLRKITAKALASNGAWRAAANRLR